MDAVDVLFPADSNLFRVFQWYWAVWGVLFFGMAIWAIKGRLPSEVRARYARRVVFMSQLPFAYQWRQSVMVEDLPMFEVARMRQNVVGVFSIVGTSLIPGIVWSVYTAGVATRCVERLFGS